VYVCVFVRTQGTLRGFTTAAAAATLTLEVATGHAVTAVVLRPSAPNQLLAAAADGTLTLWGWPREGVKGDAAASPTLLRKWRLGAPIDHVVLLNDVRNSLSYTYTRVAPPLPFRPACRLQSLQFCGDPKSRPRDEMSERWRE